MSKSKGEFLTVSLLEEKGYDPMVYRFFCLQSHYRRSLMFSWENMDNAAAAYNKLVARIAALSPAEGEVVEEEGAAALKQRFTQALDNDLNTSLAVTALYDVLKADVNATTKQSLVADFDQVLALGLLEHAAALNQKKAAEALTPADTSADTATGEVDAFTAEILRLIGERAAAKREKNYAEADRIRAYLAERGVTLIDTKEGTTYRRD
jgi:cysteinyl-tRNA synthetase